MKLASVVLALAVAASGCGSLYSPEAAAEWEARKAVKERLKSPSSAKFDVTKVAARAEAERLYVVYLVVDSQNSFGAMVRNHALALVMAGAESGDRSQVLHLEVTEKSPAVWRIQELTREMGEGWVVEAWVEG